MYKYTTFEEETKRKQIRGRVLSVLEFDKIILKLTEYAKTCYGKEIATNLCPTTDYSFVKQSLVATEEAYTYINKYGKLPFSGFADIRNIISYAAAGGVLTMRNLLDIACFLRAVERLSSVITNENADMQGTSLFQSILNLQKDSYLEKQISTSIVNDEEMNDRASDTLYNIRREKKDLQQSIRIMLERIIRNNEELLQEQLITIRGDRYCVPVRSECKSRLPGIVHDTSSTGQTVFIEPLAVVEANNRIRELINQEQEEIARILEELTRRVVRSESLLLADISLVAEIDFACAKANLAISMDASVPALNKDGYVRLVKARHPLIDKEVVVPVDIELGKDYKSLIITGPNTGGKTVSLKTCGLFTLMVMAGLMIPCATGSEVAIFDKVLADIGDEQSIEQSLSTFSAHMSNIVFILKNAKKNCLILLDELGSGTDPAEGAALAVAVLDELFERGCVTMATTHYKELKSYAIEKDGVMNASCEFDTDTLSPTYKLIIGRPGSSNAFIISEKLGLSNRIIAKAKENLSEGAFMYERLIEEAERNSKEASKLKEENTKLNDELTKAKEKLDAEYKALKASKTKVLNEARRKQQELLEEKEAELEAELKRLRKASKKDSKQQALEDMEKVRRRLRAGLKDLTDDSSDAEIETTSLPGEAPKLVVVGQEYFLPRYEQIVVCLSNPNNKGKVQVQMGAINLLVDKEELRMPTKAQSDNDKQASNAKISRKTPVKTQESSISKIKTTKSATIMPELMLLGKRADEAEDLLEEYLDDCSCSTIKTIRIVHGKGTGVLRDVVSRKLSADRRVKTFRLGTFGEGDDGVTIAELY